MEEKKKTVELLRREFTAFRKLVNTINNIFIIVHVYFGTIQSTFVPSTDAGKRNKKKRDPGNEFA